MSYCVLTSHLYVCMEIDVPAGVGAPLLDAQLIEMLHDIFQTSISSPKYCQVSGLIRSVDRSFSKVEI